jgi:1-aminocyclopropane-1-carboxylate deaminase/D-cysteine desulfhydrase-like pyridoxal-dependent ACC family enzyme
MNNEIPGRKEVKLPINEMNDEAKGKTLLWAVGAAVGGTAAALSPIGQAVSNSFDRNLFTTEVISSESELSDQVAINDSSAAEKIKVILDDKVVASFERQLDEMQKESE